MSHPRLEPVETERALLGAVLVNPALLARVDLTPESFSKQAHGKAWTVIQTLAVEGQTPDPVTITAELRRRGWLEDVGGAMAVATWIDGQSRSANVESYAAQVSEAAALRAAKAIGESTLGPCLLESDDPWQVLAEAEETLRQLAARRSDAGGLDVTEQIEALERSITRASSGPRVGLNLPAIDDALGGIQPGEVLGVMARPGIGKTIVLCHVASGLAGLGHVCFSLEMPAPQIVERLVRMTLGVGRTTIRNALSSPGLSLDFSAYVDAFADMWLDATPGLSVSQMAARVRRRQLRQRVTVVSIDHLGLVGGDTKLQTYDRVSKQARELKELAKSCDVAVVLLIQANRDAGGDGSRELHLGSARDSGVIEEACDYMVALRRLDKSTTLSQAERDQYRDLIFAKLLKHRHGPTGGEETAYRIDTLSLRLIEQPGVKAEENDLKRLAAGVGGRR